MDVLPAHLNRDSFRDSFKGLVALEIIIDLPIGFPINNIISLEQTPNVVRERPWRLSDSCQHIVDRRERHRHSHARTHAYAHPHT